MGKVSPDMLRQKLGDSWVDLWKSSMQWIWLRASTVKGMPAEATVAHHTGEAAWVVGLPHSPQNPVQDGLGAREHFSRVAWQERGQEGRGLWRPIEPLQASGQPIHLISVAPAWDS